MPRLILFVAALATWSPALRAQAAPDAGRKPADSVRLVTSDIPNFWRAYTLAAGKESAERAVWLDFRDEMATDSTIGTWMYNGRVPFPKNHGATDMGYWVGARIARSYYERATDKRAAVRELLFLPDPERLLAESGYAAYTEALPPPIRPTPPLHERRDGLAGAAHDSS